MTEIDLAETVEERTHLVHLHDENLSDIQTFHGCNIVASVILYDVMAYVHPVAEVLVARGSPAEDGSS